MNGGESTLCEDDFFFVVSFISVFFIIHFIFLFGVNLLLLYPPQHPPPRQVLGGGDQPTNAEGGYPPGQVTPWVLVTKTVHLFSAEGGGSHSITMVAPPSPLCMAGYR